MYRVFIVCCVAFSFAVGTCIGAKLNAPSVSMGPSDHDRASLTRLVRMVQRDAKTCAKHPELQRCGNRR